MFGTLYIAPENIAKDLIRFMNVTFFGLYFAFHYCKRQKNQRKRDWDDLKEMQISVETLLNLYDTIGANMRKGLQNENINGTGATNNEVIQKGQRSIYDTLHYEVDYLLERSTR